MCPSVFYLPGYKNLYDLKTPQNEAEKKQKERRTRKQPRFPDRERGKRDMRAAGKVKSKQQAKVRCGILLKLLLGTLIPLIVILTIVGVQLSGNIERTVSASDIDYLTAESSGAAERINGYFSRYIGMAELSARMEEMTRGLAGWGADFSGSEAQTALLDSLRELAETDRTIAFTWLLDLDSMEFLQSDGSFLTPATFDAASRVWYDPVVNGRETAVTGAYEDVTSGQMIVTVAAPVYLNGRMAGIFGMDVLLDTLTAELASVTIGESGYVTVFDKDHNVIYHPDSSLILKNVTEIDYSDNIREAILGHQEVEGLEYTRNGVVYDGSTVYLEDLGYFVLGILPQEEYQQHVTSITQSVIRWFVLAVAVLTVITVLFSVTITKSVKKLSAAAGRIAAGELDVKTDVSSRDEVGQLGEDIDAIVDRLKEYIWYIDEITEVLNEIGRGNFVFQLHQEYKGEFSKVRTALLEVRDTVSDTLKSVVLAANQVAGGAEQVAIGAQAQAQGATEQASGVEELAATLQDVAQQIESNAHNIEATNREIALVTEEASEGEEKMKAMLGAMEDISNNSKEVEKIIKEIEDIAFQTNILALNAAVEAARAGDAGKGFAVVADEVRTLAGKTAAASQTTAELIQKALDAVEHGKALADETSASFDKVYTTVGRVADHSKLIAENSAKQDTAIRQTAQGVDQISSVVQTNSATSEESAAASEELSSQAQMLKDLVGKFRLPEEEAAGASAAELPGAGERAGEFSRGDGGKY